MNYSLQLEFHDAIYHRYGHHLRHSFSGSLHMHHLLDLYDPEMLSENVWCIVFAAYRSSLD